MKKTWDPKRRVVVTGLGVVSSIGIGWQEFWKNLLAGKSGISEIEDFDVSQHGRMYGGEVKGFNPQEYLTRSKAVKCGRTSQMLQVATNLALEDARIDISTIKGQRNCVCIGTTVGELRVLEKFHDQIKPSKHDTVNYTLAFPTHTLSASIAASSGIRGNNTVFGNACAAGNYATGWGFDQIKQGAGDIAIVGGGDSFSRVVFTGFSRLYSVAPIKCQPFDLNRQGMMPGEGAGILILEELERARSRKAPIYAEVLGYGLSCDGHNMTQPDQQGVARAINKALNSSGVSARDVSYVSAHGTGTKENDKVECAAIKSVLDKKLPISSIKSMLGHTMGAASALESIACCLAIKKGWVPPTINYEIKDPECDIDCVPNKSRQIKTNIVINNSQAFGGNNACLVLKNCKI